MIQLTIELINRTVEYYLPVDPDVDPSLIRDTLAGHHRAPL